MSIRSLSLTTTRVAVLVFLVYVLALLGTNLIHLTVMFFLQPFADFILNKN
jgi:hypothetical protein